MSHLQTQQLWTSFPTTRIVSKPVLSSLSLVWYQQVHISIPLVF